MVARMLTVRGLVCALILNSTILLGGCSSGDAPQDSTSKEVTQKKLEDMQKGMLDSIQKKGARKK